MLQAYNCDRQSGPKKKVMPAEKQLYRPDYVLQHFIHYSAVTVISDMSRSEFEGAGYQWLKTKMFPDPNSRFADEINEASMLHTKAVARQDTAGWEVICRADYPGGGLCRIGVPYPDINTTNSTGDSNGWAYNCYVNSKVENYWVPLLQEAINKEHGHIFDAA